MLNRNNYLSIFLISIISAGIFFGCMKKSNSNNEVVSVKGSDTMVNLSQKWAEEYMKLHSDISIQVTGGGSGTGIAALLNGTVMIANASREMKEIELSKAKTQGINPIQHKVALDGIALIVNPGNGVDNLTIAQISDIFTGTITNWKQVGGNDLPITLYGRENSSGTYEFFKDNVLGKDQSGKQKDYSTTTQVLQGTAALGEAVAKDNKGIGYGGVGYFAQRKDVKILHIKKDDKSDSYSPSENAKVNYDLIWSGKYPISRYLYCYTNGELKGAGQDFLNFIVSSEGQKLVEQMEYIPLPKK
jgi:phosphate transport system substrate-binding protein